MGTGITGPSSSQTPYLKPLDSRVTFESIITTGDTVSGSFLSDGATPWRFVGIPDGLGAFDNGDGTFTVLVNHELGPTAGVARAHGSTGAFVDRLVIDKDTLEVVSARDLDTDVFLFDPATGTYTMGTTAFARFCSADLAAPSAFYDAASGLGTQARIFLNGEETGHDGRAFAHIVTGPDAGAAYELAHLGNFSYENAVASPTAGVKTIVISTDDSTPGQAYVYIGDKRATGTEVEKAGLVGGKTYGIEVAAFADETNDTTVVAAGTAFELVALGTDGDVSALTGAELQAQSEAAGVTEFLRPEDGAWDPTDAGRFYFVTTNGATSPSRLWALDFDDIANPEAGGSIKLLLDGTEGQVMFDNMTVDANGIVYLQEDPGNNTRLAKVWSYDPATDHLAVVAEHDPVRFAAAPTLPASFVTQDEESSGIIDVTDILGSPGKQAFLLDVQSHKALADPELVQDGQLLVMYVDRPIEAPQDFNIDGKSDLLFQHVDGSVQVALVDGTSVVGSGTVGTNPGPSWVAKGTGDFDGDGKTDILWQHTDGTVGIWALDGLAIRSVGGVGSNPGASWNLIDTGDFNGDGKSDLLWQNSDGYAGVWELDGTNVLAVKGIGAVPEAGWTAIATGDFDGNGKTDILGQHTDGRVGVVLLDGTTILAAEAVGTNLGTSWTAVATGDFDGDGKSGILLQNSDGALQIWDLDGTTLLAAEAIAQNPGADWNAVATGDYNGDGKSDIVLQDSNGAVQIWALDGSAVIDGIGTIVGTPDPDLLVV